MTARPDAGGRFALLAPPSDQQEEPDGHRHRRHQKASPTEEVAHSEPGIVAGRVERAGVEGQGGQHAQGDQQYPPQVAA